MTDSNLATPGPNELKPLCGVISAKTWIESKESSAITLRSALDLLSAAYALETAFAEAEIVKQLVAAYLETGATHPEVFF